MMDPLMEGVKVRLRVQVAPAANAPVQPVAVKSPLAVTEEIVKELALLFFTLTVLMALAVPTAWLVNETLAGVIFNSGADPVALLPVSATSCGLKAASSVIVSTPLIVAFASGVKVTARVHFVPAVRLVPHVVPVPPAV